jgi:peptidyl-tRNA hydrolase
MKSARIELARCREKQAAEEKKATALDKDADAKQRNARSTRSLSLRESYLKQAIKKREDANAARGRAARHAGEAAKAQKKVHDAETKLRAEEQREERKAEENRRATEKKATIQRERADSRRESAHRKEVATLRAQIDDQAQLLATAPWDRTLETITVLFVASSPEDQDGLREHRPNEISKAGDQPWASSPLRSSSVRIWPSHSVPSWRPFGSWSPRSQRHVVIIASTRIRHSRSKR